MPAATKLLTYDEWLTLPDFQSGREECVEGVVEQMPPPKWKHTVVVERLTRQLWKKLDETTTMVVSSNFGLVIRRNPVTQRTPDIAVFSLAALVECDGYIHSAPELAVEVLSPANTPRRIQETLDDYQSIRVPEVWVVKPDDRSVTACRLGAAGYQASEYGQDAMISPCRFPSATIELELIWHRE